MTAAAVGLIWAIVTGTIWYAAKLMGSTIILVAKEIGAVKLTSAIVTILGTSWSYTFVVAKSITGW